MISPSAVLQSQTLDKTQTFNLALLNAASSILVTRDVSTPVADPVVVTVNGLSISAATTFTVTNGATLALNNVLSIGALQGISIGSSGTLSLGQSIPVSIGVPISFSGPNADLVLNQTGLNISVGSPLSGFTGSDTIDFRNVTNATSVQYNNGTISLLNGTTVEASVAVSGFFGVNTLGMVADGSGGYSVGDNISGVTERLSGVSSSYVIVPASNAVGLVQDTVVGRDAATSLGNNQTVGFTDGVGLVDPLGNAETIAHLYQAVLGRTPDLNGLQGLTQQVDQGTLPVSSLGDVFVLSEEFTQAHGTLNNAQFVDLLAANTNNGASTTLDQQALTELNAGTDRGTVAMQFASSVNNIQQTLSFTGDTNYGETYRLYETTLGRAPDVGGAAHFLSELQGGASLTTIAQEFISSAEFAKDFGQLSNTAFVTTLYQDGLGRAPDQGGLTAFVNELNAGGSRGSVAVAISDSLESRVRTASATHDGWVFTNH